MKIKLFDSIGFRVIAFYTMLSLITLSFIISVIFENQIELISRNSMLESEKQLSELVGSLKKFTAEMREGTLFDKKNSDEILTMLADTISPYYGDYIIFSETRSILRKSPDSIELPLMYKDDASRAMTAHAFSGKDYYMRIDEAEKAVYFYIPLDEFHISQSNDTILFVRASTAAINASLSALYRQAVYIIAVVLLFHAIFPAVLYRAVFYPIKQLTGAAQKISAGEYSIRVPRNSRKDELGALAESFNTMADTVYRNIDALTREVKVAKTISEVAEKIATRDVMTGLVNINYLTERIDDEILQAKVNNRGIAFLLIDMDNFNNKNELYGKQTSDILILETVRKIKENCGDADIVARSGGDEFAVLAPACSRERTGEIAEKIRKSVESQKVVTPDGNLSVTVSIGVVHILPERLYSILSYVDITGQAKNALTLAKQNGKNRLEFAQG